MSTRLDIADLSIEVVRKPIKHLHLGVHPPDGRVRIAAPERMAVDAIRVFAIGKLAWIRRQQSKLLAQLREAPREYVDRESHYVWGRRYLLQVVEKDAQHHVRLLHRHLRLQVRACTSTEEREQLLNRWYRDQIRLALPELLDKWQRRLGVSVSAVYVQQMKTKWGGCSPLTRNIRLNTELAKKPPECLEYILVHELAHLRAPTHGHRFVELMDDCLPGWRATRDQLNALPVRTETW